jgi:hypothetical protein
MLLILRTFLTVLKIRLLVNSMGHVLPSPMKEHSEGWLMPLPVGVDNSRFVNFLLKHGARMQDQPLRKMDEYTPKTTMERLAYGLVI